MVLTSGSCSGQHVPQPAAWLHVSSVGIDIDVANGLLDPDADAESLSRVGVEDVDKVGIVRGQPSF